MTLPCVTPNKPTKSSQAYLGIYELINPNSNPAASRTSLELFAIFYQIACDQAVDVNPFTGVFIYWKR